MPYPNRAHGHGLGRHQQAGEFTPFLQREPQAYFDWIPCAQPNIQEYDLSAFAANQGEVDVINGAGLPLPIAMFQSTAQTLTPIFTAGKGLEVALDQVNNEAVEYVPGGIDSRNPLSYLLGTDRGGVFIEATLEISDASGLDQMMIGWRKTESAFAVPTSLLSTGDGIYTDFCGIGFAGTAADPNTVRVSHDLNNSGSSVVGSAGFTWADTKVHKVEMRVVGRVASYLINNVRLGDRVSKDALGVAITAQQTVKPAAFTFDTADRIHPWLFYRQDADLSPVYLRRLTIGRLFHKGIDV